jgi:hypothetical protein
MVGGTFTSAGTCTVSAVSSGVITAVTATSGGAYTVAPTNPVSVTGGSGSGATFNLTWAVISFTITNAGSGYIEQPTVTFSGGGGSGAAAYATVGSGTIVRSLGSTMDFYVPSSISSASPALRITDGGSSTIYPQINNFGNTVNILAAGATNTQLLLGSSGTSPIAFTTNSTSRIEQFRVAHTASAVNYVQVTGAATGGVPLIQSLGSDANIDIRLAPKGTGSVALMDSAGLSTIRAVARAASGDTFLDVQRAVGFVDLIASSGVTDGDIRFTPKGTGRVRFGTYTGTVLVPTGFIEIKDSSGTTRRLLVG